MGICLKAIVRLHILVRIKSNTHEFFEGKVMRSQDVLYLFQTRCLGAKMETRFVFQHQKLPLLVA